MPVKSFNFLTFTAAALMVGLAISASAAEVGWQKLIDDGFYLNVNDPLNKSNCEHIYPYTCNGGDINTPGRCGPDKVTAEFYCAGPWRSDAGSSGIGNAYLFLSDYEDVTWSPPKVQRGWAVWQWEVKTTGIYEVEVYYRPTNNRTPDANYVVLSLNSLGEMDNSTVLAEKTIDQTLAGPLQIEGWVTLAKVEYQSGEVAALGLWGNDDTYSDTADAARWTLIETNNNGVLVGPNFMLLK